MKFIEIFLQCHFPNVYTYFYAPHELEIIKWTTQNINFNSGGRTIEGRSLRGYAKSPWYCTRSAVVLVQERIQEEIAPGTFDTAQSITYYPESIFSRRKTYEILTYYTSGNRSIRWMLAFYRNLKKRAEGEWEHNGAGVIELRDSAGNCDQKSQMLFFKKHGFTRYWDSNGKHYFKFYIDNENRTSEISEELGYDIESANEIPQEDIAFIKLKYMDYS